MSNKSYKRYRQYRATRQQYKMDQIAFPIVVMLIIAFFTKYKTFILALIILFVIGKILSFLSYGRKGAADEVTPSEEPASNESFASEIPA